MNTGLALKAAIDHGRERQGRIAEATGRQIYIRFMTQFGGTAEKRIGVTIYPYDSPGLLIRAGFAAKNKQELEAQGTNCEVLIPWDELDARAGELVSIVDQCIAAAEAAVEAVSDAPRYIVSCVARESQKGKQEPA
jgi:hypothetical protein